MNKILVLGPACLDGGDGPHNKKEVEF